MIFLLIYSMLIKLNFLGEKRDYIWRFILLREWPDWRIFPMRKLSLCLRKIWTEKREEEVCVSLKMVRHHTLPQVLEKGGK